MKQLVPKSKIFPVFLFTPFIDFSSYTKIDSIVSDDWQGLSSNLTIYSVPIHLLFENNSCAVRANIPFLHDDVKINIRRKTQSLAEDNRHKAPRRARSLRGALQS